jgi:DnaK suppressor protein
MSLSNEQKAELKSSLEKRMQDIERELEGLKEAAKPVDLEESIGRLARMDAIQDQQIAIKTKNEKEKLLTAIKMSLEKIDSEDFGLCAECGEEIQFKRLLKRPESLFCIHCQSAQE